MKTSLSRRAFLGSAAVSTSAAFSTSAFGFAVNKKSSPTAKVHDLRVISKMPEFYHGWPTLTRRANGQLLAVWSGGREAHVCPFGRVDMMRSHDNGETWTWPRTLLERGHRRPRFRNSGNRPGQPPGDNLHLPRLRGVLSQKGDE